MIRLQCPACGVRLNVADEKAGQSGTCPACKSSFHIPDAAEGPAAPASAITPEPAVPRPAPSPISSHPTMPPLPPRAGSSEAEEEPGGEFDRRPGRGKRVRKRRLKTDAEPWQWNCPIIYGSIAAALGMLSLILALIHPFVAVLLMVVGCALALLGRIWYSSISRADDYLGFRLLLGFDQTILTSEFDRKKWAWLLQILGTVIALMGYCAFNIDEMGQ
jgi:hypothetical protein